MDTFVNTLFVFIVILLIGNMIRNRIPAKPMFSRGKGKREAFDLNDHTFNFHLMDEPETAERSVAHMPHVVSPSPHVSLSPHVSPSRRFPFASGKDHKTKAVADAINRLEQYVDGRVANVKYTSEYSDFIFNDGHGISGDTIRVAGTPCEVVDSKTIRVSK